MPLRKNIIITGASSGLGEGMARRFAKSGRNLALCARREERLAALAAQLRAEYGVTVVTRSLDVNNHDQVFKAFEEFRGELGSVDRVIVNAGINHGWPVGTGHFHDNEQTMQTNLIASLAQAEAAIGIFREQNNGHLVMVTSMGAVRGFPGKLTVYNASKSGATALADGIRYDLLGSPIKVTALLPGYIDTELNDEPQLKRPYVSTLDAGVKSAFKAIESETAKAIIPAFPWLGISLMIRAMPARRLKKLL